MTHLDDKIRNSLSGADRAIYDQTEELGYFSLGLAQFQGKLGWVTWVIMVTQAALFVAGVWCAVQFFAATDVLIALKWGLPSAVLIIVAASLKFSLMPQMQAARILRELKRVELLLAARG